MLRKFERKELYYNRSNLSKSLFLAVYIHSPPATRQQLLLMSHRLIRVCELLKRELSLVIAKEISFEIPLVSVRAVDITPDLKRAHVAISAFGTPQQKERVIALLEKNRPHLQKEVSKRVILKHTPTLIFQLDESIERGARVLHLLDELEIPDQLTSFEGSAEEEV